MAADFQLTLLTLKSAATVSVAQAGEAISQGSWIYILGTDSKAYLADNTVSTKLEVVGIAIEAAASGDYVAYVDLRSEAVIGVNETLTTTTTLCLGAAGKTHYETDLVSTEYLVKLGTANTANQITIKIDNTELQKP